MKPTARKGSAFGQLKHKRFQHGGKLCQLAPPYRCRCGVLHINPRSFYARSDLSCDVYVLQVQDAGQRAQRAHGWHVLLPLGGPGGLNERRRRRHSGGRPAAAPFVGHAAVACGAFPGCWRVFIQRCPAEAHAWPRVHEVESCISGIEATLFSFSFSFSFHFISAVFLELINPQIKSKIPRRYLDIARAPLLKRQVQVQVSEKGCTFCLL